LKKILDALTDFLDSLLPQPPQPRPIPVRVKNRHHRR
jgi:hypothetical protein